MTAAGSPRNVTDVARSHAHPGCRARSRSRAIPRHLTLSPPSSAAAAAAACFLAAATRRQPLRSCLALLPRRRPPAARCDDLSGDAPSLLRVGLALLRVGRPPPLAVHRARVVARLPVAGEQALQRLVARGAVLRHATLEVGGERLRRRLLARAQQQLDVDDATVVDPTRREMRLRVRRNLHKLETLVAADVAAVAAARVAVGVGAGGRAAAPEAPEPALTTLRTEAAAFGLRTPRMISRLCWMSAAVRGSRSFCADARTGRSSFGRRLTYTVPPPLGAFCLPFFPPSFHGTSTGRLTAASAAAAALSASFSFDATARAAAARTSHSHANLPPTPWCFLRALLPLPAAAASSAAAAAAAAARRRLATALVVLLSGDTAERVAGWRAEDGAVVTRSSAQCQRRARRRGAPS